MSSDERVWIYLYIATPAGREQPSKLGYSLAPRQRLQQLNCGRHDALELRAVVPCHAAIPEWGTSSPYRAIESRARYIERKAHRALELFRLRGEWFDIEWTVAAHVAEQACER